MTTPVQPIPATPPGGDGLPDFSWAKPTIQSPQPNDTLPDFSWASSPTQQKQQGFVDYTKNLIVNGYKANAIMNTIQIAKMTGNPGVLQEADPESQRIMSALQQSEANGGAAHIAFSDFANMFGQMASNAKRSMQQIISGDAFTGPGGFTGFLGNLGKGFEKPIADVAELSTGLKLTDDDVSALTPEEKAARIKSAVAFGAATVASAGLADALAPAAAVAGVEAPTAVATGLTQRILKNAAIGGAGGATYGAVAGANEKDQLAQIISGGIFGGTLGAAHSILFGEPQTEGTVTEKKAKPAEYQQVRQIQSDQNSMNDVISLTHSIGTSDDLAEALITGKIGLKQGEIVHVPGVDLGNIDKIRSQLPDNTSLLVHAGDGLEPGQVNVLVHDSSVPVDEDFFAKTGFIKGQLVSYGGSSSWQVLDGDGKLITIKDLNRQSSGLTPIRGVGVVLDNEQELKRYAQEAGYDPAEYIKYQKEEAARIAAAKPSSTPVDNSIVRTNAGSVKQLSAVKLGEPSLAPKLTAAIRTDDGSVFTGTLHVDAAEAAFNAGKLSTVERDNGHYHSGFLTKDNTYLNRQQALAYANKNPGVGTPGVRAEQGGGLDATDLQGITRVSTLGNKDIANRLYGEWRDDVNKPEPTNLERLQDLRSALVDMARGQRTVAPYNDPIGFDEAPPSSNDVVSQRIAQLDEQIAQEKITPQEASDEGEGSNFLDRANAVNGRLAQHLSNFLDTKGFNPDQSSYLKQEFQLRIRDEALANNLDPDEFKLIRDANIDAKPVSQQVKDIKNLSRLAKQNGMSISDGGSGRLILRGLDDGHIIDGFDSAKDLVDFLNRSGQADGVDLDANATMDAGIGGGGRGLPPNSIEGTPEYPSDQPYNFFTRAKNIAKGTVGEEFIRGADNFKLITRNREFLLNLDKKYGTSLHEKIMENTQKARNIRDGIMKPYIDQIGELMKSSKGLDEGGREMISRHMQTLSPEEVILKGMSRPMNPLEIAFGRQAFEQNIDLERVFKYSRELEKLDKEYPMVDRQADPQKEAEYQSLAEGAKNAYAMSPSDLAFKSKFDAIKDLNKSEASLGGIVRFARALQNKDLSADEFAAKYQLDARQLGASDKLSAIYEKLASVFGISPEQRLGGYMTHARLYTDGNMTEALKHFSGDTKAKDFYAALSRTGEISPYEMDPFKAALRYIKGGFDVKSGFNDALSDAQNGLKEELKKLPGTIQDNVSNVVNRYLNDIRGFPEAGDRAANEAVNYIMDKYKLGEDVNVRKEWVNALTSTFAAAGLGLRPMLGIGHFGISTIISTSARSLAYTARVLKQGAYALAHPEVMEKLQLEQGAFANLAPYANIREPGIVRNVIDKASDVFFKATLLPTAYDGFAAGHYLATQADAFKALTDFNRGDLDWKGVRKATFLNQYDAPVINRFRQLAQTNPADAANYLAIQAVNDLVGVYGAANHPYMWGTNTGRVMGQFGNFAMWTRSTVQRMASRGTVGQRVASMAKLTAMSVGVAAVGEELGIDLSRMNPYHAMAWLFGPAVHIAEDAVTAVKGSGYEQQAAQRRLLKLLPYDAQKQQIQPSIFIPASFAVHGLIQAADDFSKGKTGLGIADIVGFNQNSQRPPAP